MTTYLKISSPVETSPEAFTVLGASSARGEESSIGQFGSGAKHAVLCALREKLPMIIYCGKTKIVPQTTPQIIHGVEQDRVSFRIGNKTEQSSMVLDFGSLDWTDPVRMMMRELISNALDAVDGEFSKITIETDIEKPRAKSGYTTIYVAMCREIREYLEQLHHYFLHVDNEHQQTVLRQNPGPCRFYRKGVFVHSVEKKSLFSYNCGDDLPIDESRNLDSHRVRVYAAKLLAKDKQSIKTVLKTIVGGVEESYYEHGFSAWYLKTPQVAESVRELYGEDVCVTDNEVTLSRAKSKGLNVIFVKLANWYEAIKEYLPTAISKLSRIDSEGLQLIESSEQLLRSSRFVWNHLDSNGLTGTLELPTFREFEKPINCESVLKGFYSAQDNIVYIHRDETDNLATIAEELAHYITGAGDRTRDLQDFAFKFCGLLMKG